MADFKFLENKISASDTTSSIGICTFMRGGMRNTQGSQLIMYKPCRPLGSNHPLLTQSITQPTVFENGVVNESLSDCRNDFIETHTIDSSP